MSVMLRKNPPLARPIPAKLTPGCGRLPGVETGAPTEEKETTTLEADSPEECDAWDVWVDELKTVRELLRNVWTAAETVPV